MQRTGWVQSKLGGALYIYIYYHCLRTHIQLLQLLYTANRHCLNLLHLGLVFKSNVEFTNQYTYWLPTVNTPRHSCSEIIFTIKAQTLQWIDIAQTVLELLKLFLSTLCFLDLEDVESDCLTQWTTLTHYNKITKGNISGEKEREGADVVGEGERERDEV